MNKLNFLSRIKSALIIALIFLISTPTIFAGGGGGATPSLNTKEGLERAADNFLASFALITIDKKIKLTPQTPKGDLAVSNYVLSLNELAYYNFGGSLWEFLLANAYMIPLTSTKEVTHAEYEAFMKEHSERKINALLNAPQD